MGALVSASALLEGGAVWRSPDLRFGALGWGDADFGGRRIEELRLVLPGGRGVLMRGMCAYAVAMECVASVYGGGLQQLAGVWLCGAQALEPGARVHVWHLGFASGKLRRGVAPWGRECGGQAVSGYKPGVPGRIVCEAVAA